MGSATSRNRARKRRAKAIREKPARVSPRLKASSAGKGAASVAQVRMYCHGLGDCFLLRFPREDSEKPFHVLIDCGLIAVAEEPKRIMERVVRNIKQTCEGHLDLVIVTHEHWDHVSGFSTQQARDIFDEISIDRVWYAWTEDPSPANKLGQKLRREREAKVRAVHRAALALAQLGEPLTLARAKRIGSLLTFFGYEYTHDPSSATLPADDREGTIGKTRAAFDYLAKRRGVSVRYCRPTDAPVTLPGTGGVRTYVLGPPEDEDLIKRSSPTRKGGEVYELDSELLMDQQLESAFARLAGDFATDETDCPFDAAFRRDFSAGTPPSAALEILKNSVWDPEPWRQISHDWTAMAETIALNLDRHTNNTCLVVAFELGPGGRVMLFAADAQVGNWLSWQDLRWHLPTPGDAQDVSGPELLSRTMFYKVGHHGSHNATLRKLGLEQMTSDELVAFVPVNKEQAMKNRWNEMPFEPLMNRLREKTGGRTVLSDPATTPPAAAALGSLSAREREVFLRSLARNPGSERLYWDLQIPL